MRDNNNRSDNNKIDGIFNGLNRFVDIISDMVETGKNFAQYSGEIGDAKDKKGIHGSYGINIHMGNNGKEHIEEIRDAINSRPKIDKEKNKVIEPQVDVFDEEDKVIYVMELPGIDEEDIKMNFNEKSLEINAENPYKIYRKTIALNIEAKDSDISKALKNGILRITIQKPHRG